MTKLLGSQGSKMQLRLLGLIRYSLNWHIAPKMSGLVHIPLQKDAAEMDTMDIGVAETVIFM